MTTSCSLPTTEDLTVAVQVIDNALTPNFTAVKLEDSGNVQQVTYRYNAGTLPIPLIVIARREYSPKTGLVNCSLRLTTDLRDDAYDPILVQGLETMLVWKYNKVSDSIDLIDEDLATLAINAVFGLLFPTVDGSTHTSITKLSMFSRGILSDLF